MLANISFYRWGGSTTNQLTRRKIGLGSNKFVKFTDNLEAFLHTGTRAIMPPLIYTKGLPKAPQQNKSKHNKDNNSNSNSDFDP